jgi:hypothetical protein
MNNSGETETFKYSGYTSPLKQVGTSILPISSSALVDNIVLIGANSSVDNDFRFASISIGASNQIRGPRAVGIGHNQSQLVDDCVLIGNGASGSGNGGIVAIGSGAFGRGNYGISIGVGAQVGNLSGADRTINVGPETSISGSYSTNFGAANTINCERGIILGTTNNLTSPYSVIIGSNHNISSTGYYNTILGGFGNVISGATSGTTLIGLSGYTQPLESDTAYVNNLQVLRTPSTRVQPISSGTTFTCNLDLGAKSQFYITGTSTINITNVRDGASFMIKTETDGNYVMTWTATGGYTFVFEGGIKDPGNNVTDIFVFEVFGSVIYGNRRHNYS